MAFPVGPIHIFPYRVLLPLMWLFFLGEVALRSGKITITYVKGVRAYLRFLLIWLTYAFFTIVWALDKIAAIREIIFLFMGVSIIFFVVYFLSDEAGLWNLYKLWILLLIILLPVALWEISTGNHLRASGLYEYQPRKALDIYAKFMPSTVFRNPNDFATFLTLSIPFVFTWMRYAKKTIMRIAALGVLFITLYVLLMTYSRTNYIAIILEFAFFFLIILRIKDKARFAVSLGFLGLFFVAVKPGIIERVLGLFVGQMTSLTSPYSLYSGSVFVRVNLIRNSLVFLLKTCGFGVGAGNAEYWMEHFSVYNTQGILNVHNWWIEIMVNFGLWIFVGYILFYMGLVRNIYRAYRLSCNNLHDRIICETLLLSLIGFFAASISSSSIMTLRPQWFLFAFALAFLNYSRNKASVRSLK